MSTHDDEPRWAAREARVTPKLNVVQDVRDELLNGPTGIDIAAANWHARIAFLPLVRHDGTQGVRIVFHSPDATNVRVRIAGAESTFAHAGTRTRHVIFVEPSTGAQSVHVEAHGDVAEARLDVDKPRPWEIYLVHHSHLDIGYTDPQPVVLDQHLQYLDATLELAAATEDWPEASQFRWNVETTLPLERWLAARPAVAREEFIARTRTGQFEVCALAYNMHTEAYSIDELARSLQTAVDLRERHGIEIVSAMQTDVPGAAPGLATLLTAAGVRFLSVAHNYAGRSVPYLNGGQSLRRPFWWRAPNASRLLVWMTDSPHGVAYMEGNLLGLAESVDLAEALLPEYLAALAEHPYPFTTQHEWLGLIPGFEATKSAHQHELLHLRVQGMLADNAPPSLRPSEIVRSWNERYAIPSLRLATNREFFTAAESRLGDDLDEWDGDWTDWWADGIGSAARAVGMGRRAQGAIRTAQTLHVLADHMGSEASDWQTESDRAYEALGLFDEHTWGAGNPWSNALDEFDSGELQWQRKIAFAHDGNDRANALVEAGKERLAHLVRPNTNADGSILVVNGSGRPRTDLVRVFAPVSRADIHKVELRSPDGERVPLVLERQSHASFRADGTWVSFVARDVPACGWARYDFVAANPSVAQAGSDSSGVLENEHLRVSVDLESGAVASLLDLDNETELVESGSAFGFNSYVYDRYASAAHFNHLSSRIPKGSRWLLGGRSLTRDGVVVSRVSNDVWDALTVRLVVDGADYLESTYRLVSGLNRLDITNRLAKTPTDEKESVYFVFPFAGRDAEVEWEVTGGVSGDGHASVPGSARHMRAIRHWATIATSTAQCAWATLEAPLVQRGDIHLPYRPFPGTVPPGEMTDATIVSWAMNNLWDTNFPPRQGGETTFRYAVAPGGRRTAVALGASLAEPLVGVVLAGRGHGSDNAATGSVLELDRADVELVHLARSRRGHDLVAVLHSRADVPVDVNVSFAALPVKALYVGSFLEGDLQPLNGVPRITLAPGEMVTLALDLDGGAR